MLNKNICKKCLKQRRRHWVEYDENRWNNKKIWCRKYPGVLKQFNSINEPPHNCPYTLEHLVND